jgi:hypothetical protein
MTIAGKKSFVKQFFLSQRDFFAKKSKKVRKTAVFPVKNTFFRNFHRREKFCLNIKKHPLKVPPSHKAAEDETGAKKQFIKQIPCFS